MAEWTFFRRPGDPRKAAAGWPALAESDPVIDIVRRAAPELMVFGARVRACALSFYRQPSQLCEIVHDALSSPRYCVVHGAGTAEAGCSGVLEPGRAILALNRRLGLKLDEATVKDYLYFWLAHGCTSAERLVPVEDLEHLRWRAVPRSGERALLGPFIRPMRVVPYRSTGSFELAATALDGDNLVSIEVAVSSFGHVSIQRRTPRLWALPVVNDRVADWADQGPRFCAAGGEACVEASAEPELLARIERMLPPAASLPNRFMIQDLPFFEGVRLYRGLYVGDGSSRSPSADDPAGCGLFALKSAAAIYLLDGSSAPIHEAREKEAFSLRCAQSGAIDPGRVLAYVGFFCRMICGDQGPFHLLEEICDLNVLRSPRSTATRRTAVDERHYDRFRLDEIAAFTRPLELTGIDGDVARVDGCVQYGDALFGAQFTVSARGDIEMEGDLPAVSGLPVNWVRNTSAYRRRPLASA